jgi:tetratricopeptide (TPR) repeat protein
MRKKRKNRTAPPPQTSVPSISLQTVLGKAENLYENGDFRGTINLLQPFAKRFRKEFQLHTLLAAAYVKEGEIWTGIVYYQKALSIKRDKKLLVTLGYIYMNIGLNALALKAFREGVQSTAKEPFISEIRSIIEDLEDQLLDIAYMLGITPDKADKGLRYLEEGQIALHEGAFLQSIYLNRKAIRYLGNFPAPHNNLSLALFLHGEHEEGIRTAHQVLEMYPDNIQTLSNLIRFLAWTGKTEEARKVWEHLMPLEPIDKITRLKKLDAAAIMEVDEDVRRLVTQNRSDKGQDKTFSNQEQFFLAIAEANLGDQKSAIRRLRKLENVYSQASEIIKALKGGKPGLGWAERFSYYSAMDMIPRGEMEAFLDILSRVGSGSNTKTKKEIARFAARYPQLILVGKKTLIEDRNPDEAIKFLSLLGTPQAYAVLREFGLGTQGDDEARIQALFALLDNDLITTSDPIRVWQKGEWKEIILKKQAIIEKPVPEYDKEVIDLLESALNDFNENKLAQAEKKFERILRLEPRAKEAYNNLGAVYAHQDKHREAREMMHKALEIDPLYVMPRCNLTSYLLDEGKIEEAVDLINPLNDILQFHPMEFALLAFVRARIHLAKNENELAQKNLETALQVYPDYEPAKKLLNHLTMMKTIKDGFSQMIFRYSSRQSEKRLRQRSVIKTPDPTLEEALSIYTKDSLTGIASLVMPKGGWSSYKKDQLREHLVKYLMEPGTVSRLLDTLPAEDKAAFHYVIDNGGYLEWDAFDNVYGNDLEESQSWFHNSPKTVMGRLRAHGLLVEALVADKFHVCIPVELRR